jgi:hypothetical protein
MTIEENHITASDGKVFQNKITGDIYGNELWLGNIDSADNYDEIDPPLPEQNPKDYLYEKLMGNN